MGVFLKVALRAAMPGSGRQERAVGGESARQARFRRADAATSRGGSPLEARRDARSGRAVFLADCHLSEHTRYPGGACRSCCGREVVGRCLDAELGMEQMPCPEELAWGGVGKRPLLPVYGPRYRAAPLFRFRCLLLLLFLRHSHYRYWRLARRVAAQIADYRRAGYTVVGVVGIDGSPTCGVDHTIAACRAVEGLAALRPGNMTRERANAVIRVSVAPGPGLFVAALLAERRRHLTGPFVAHALHGELAGEPSCVRFAG